MLARAMILVGIVVALALPSARAAAQVDAPPAGASVSIEPELREAVAMLDAPSWSEREVAMLDLLDGAADISQLYALLAEKTLSAEQRFRLLLVLEERIVAAPSGAIGVRVDRRFAGEIIVEDVLPDLPASAVLRQGDRLTHLNGAPLTSWAELVTFVQHRPPGTEITLGVERRVREGGAEAKANDAERDAQWAPDRKPADADEAEPGAGKAVERPEGDDAELAPQPVEKFDVRLALGSAEKLRDPLTGETPRNDQLVSERRAIANEAKLRWSPAPFRASLDPEQAGDLIGIGEVPPVDPAIDPVPTGDQLASELEKIMSGNDALDEVRQVMVSRRLDALERVIADPRVPPEKRMQYQEIARRASGMLGDR